LGRCCCAALKVSAIFGAYSRIRDTLLPNAHKQENLFSSSLISTRNLAQRPRNGGSTARAVAPWPAKRARNHRVRNKFDDISNPAVIIMTLGRVGSAGPIMRARSPPNLMGPYPPKHRLAKFAAIAVRSRRRERRRRRQGDAIRVSERLLHFRTSPRAKHREEGLLPRDHNI
jgi:hypothetical protein